jgi:hypothetical protein
MIRFLPRPLRARLLRRSKHDDRPEMDGFSWRAEATFPVDEGMHNAETCPGPMDKVWLVTFQVLHQSLFRTFSVAG